MFNAAKIALLSCLLFSCVHKKDAAIDVHYDMQQIADKRVNYINWTKSHQDANGFIETGNCDSLNFSGLLGAGGAPVNILAARDMEGLWHRRPLNYPHCYPNESASEISQDAFLSIGWYLLKTVDLTSDQKRDIANSILAYGNSHDWKMGEGRDDLVYMPFWTQSVIAEMAYRFGGDNDQKLRDYLNVPVADFIWQKGFKGFRAHLQVMLILFRGELVGSIDSTQLDVLKWQVNRQPNNAIFQYALHHFTDGDQYEAKRIALDESICPSDHLPTAKTRDCHWAWEVDSDSCGPNPASSEEFSGGDCLFIFALLTQ